MPQHRSPVLFVLLAPLPMSSAQLMYRRSTKPRRARSPRRSRTAGCSTPPSARPRSPTSSQRDRRRRPAERRRHPHRVGPGEVAGVAAGRPGRRRREAGRRVIARAAGRTGGQRHERGGSRACLGRRHLALGRVVARRHGLRRAFGHARGGQCAFGQLDQPKPGGPVAAIGPAEGRVVDLDLRRSAGDLEEQAFHTGLAGSVPVERLDLDLGLCGAGRGGGVGRRHRQRGVGDLRRHRAEIDLGHTRLGPHRRAAVEGLAGADVLVLGYGVLLPAITRSFCGAGGL